ncbi:MAG: response regulator [Polyangiaceae bacterium]
MPEPPDSARRPRLLVVDDAPDMRRTIARLLRGKVEIVEAHDGQMAFELIEKAQADGAQFDALLIDVEMPRMNGKETLAAIVSIAPRLAERAIVMSGGAWDTKLGAWLSSLPPHRLLRKPMSIEALRDAVERALL